MVNKFGRNYHLEVSDANGSVISIDLPFTIEFEVIRNTLSSANAGSFKVYNLSVETRNRLRKDRLNIQDRRFITLRAGYGNDMAIVFQGEVTQCWSAREGVNMVTTMESFDSNFIYVNTTTNRTFPEGTPIKEIIESFIKDAGLDIGAIGEVPGTIKKAKSYSGNPIDLTKELVGHKLFIDNSKAFIVGEDEVTTAPEILVSSETGLLGTPIREQEFLNFDILFNPKITLAQVITLQSKTEKVHNGSYKVTSVKHHGVISPVISGSAITSVGVIAITKAIKYSGEFFG